jgi:hypothetical protein
MILTLQDGIKATDPTTEALIEKEGYVHCYTQSYRSSGVPCPFWISPEAQTKVAESADGYYTCPVCYHSYNLLHELPALGVPEEVAAHNWEQSREPGNYQSGGTSISGLSVGEIGEIGENLVRNLGEIPGYGKIVWWHPGGIGSNSPLDGATTDWGIEVKTLSMDTKNHRWIPGDITTKSAKDEHAAKLGVKGVLGLLVLLNFRTNFADIYVKEMPDGVKTFRSVNAEHLVAEVPFHNPYMDPTNPSPVGVTEGVPESAGFGATHPDMPF